MILCFDSSGAGRIKNVLHLWLSMGVGLSEKRSFGDFSYWDTDMLLCWEKQTKTK